MSVEHLQNYQHLLRNRAIASQSLAVTDNDDQKIAGMSRHCFWQALRNA